MTLKEGTSSYFEVKKIEGNLRYRVDKNTYLKVMNYLRGIREIEETGESLNPYFICKKGAIYFLTFPGSERGQIVCSEDLKFSDDDKKNKFLKDSLESMLKNKNDRTKTNNTA